ncbi:HNH endonuclease signature motif containing protein [Rhodococcus spelaei]|uniref:HNH endonuclease signature motif containing protein n=1 Tax=Rhodococcus spelaei TaxID=2546320 RepID=UPI001FE63C06|nr:HNH endonuclease signature motif containing protein [Rhodococcus spelaei]
MFESDGSSQAGVLDGIPDCEWPSALVDQHAAIARAQFREVDAAATVYIARCAQDARRGRNEAFQGEFAHVEVAGILHITEAAAQNLIGLGCDLRWRLHRVSALFAAGKLDLVQATVISDALANVSEDALDELERRMVEGAARCTSTALRRRAKRLIARHDPEGARSRRERAVEDRDVRVRAADDGMCTLEGLMPAAAGQVVAMRLRSMAFDVCAHDPRTFAQRRADALQALAEGHGRLECLCGRRECTANDVPKSSGVSVPPITPNAAEPGGQDSGNAVELAVSDGDLNSSATVAAEPGGQDSANGSSDTASHGVASAATAVALGVPSATTSTPPALPPLPKATIMVGVNATTLLGLDDLPGYLAGYGPIDADLARELAEDGTWRKVLTLSESDREAILDALCGTEGSGRAGSGDSGVPDPDPDTVWLTGRRVDTAAHGPILGIGRSLSAAGITPAAVRERTRRRREALTYRPSARLVEIVRTRDGTCRFPGCTARASTCDIDHTVHFDHADPAAGGWTVEQNLACLCRRHHRLKTSGRWKVRQVGGGRLEWTDPNGIVTVTEPAGAFADPDVGLPFGPLTDDATMERLFGPHRGRGVEDDLVYILDALAPDWRNRDRDVDPSPKPVLVVDLSEPAPF